MVNRKRKRRIALVALLAFVLGTTAFAYAASITFNGASNAGAAGQGSGDISGYNVTNIHYTLSDTDPSDITGVAFDLGPDTATTVKAKITGMADNDRIVAGGHDDCILGGAGNDSINAGGGFDVCLGGPGVDTFRNCEVVFQ